MKQAKEEWPMKILLVDDNPIFLEGLKNLLEAEGAAEICTAQSGRQALEKTAGFAPDAVLMDAEMHPFFRFGNRAAALEKRFPRENHPAIGAGSG